MQPTTAIRTLATYAAPVIGLADVQYPAIGRLPKYPALVLFWDKTVIHHGSEQMWVMTVRGQLFVALTGKTENDIALADPLITPLVDAFAPGTRAYRLESTARDDRVDYCQINTVSPSLKIGYAGIEHYGAEVFFEIKIRRIAGDS